MHSNGSSAENFSHAIGDVVLVRWSDERIYYAKIKTINKNRQTCQVMFEDNRRGTAEFDQIHAVDSAVDDWIACIVCKFGTSEAPNEIVLCDKCGVAFHQNCHQPKILDSALEPSAPWVCVFCLKDKPNPHLKRGEDDTPFADGRRRASTSTQPNSQMKASKSRKETLGQIEEYNSKEADSSSEESANSEEGPETTAAPNAPLAPSVGKRRQRESSAATTDLSLPPKKRKTSPTPSSSPTRNIDAESGKTAEVPRLHGAVIDSQKVAAYAKWKQTSQQTTRADPVIPEKVVKTSTRVQETPLPKQAGQPHVSYPTRNDVVQPSKTAYQALSTPQPQVWRPMISQSHSGAYQNRFLPVAVQANQSSTRSKDQAVVAPVLHSKVVKSLSGTTQKRVQDLATSTGTFSAGCLQLKPGQNASAGLSVTTLREHFEVHYSRLIRSMQQAVTYLPNPTKRGTTALAEQRVYQDQTHNVSLIRGSLLSSSPAVTRHKMVANETRHALPSRHSAFPGCVVSHNQTMATKQTSQEQTKKYKCAGCGGHAQFVCSRCQNVWYCSRLCQERSYMLFCQNCTIQE